MQRRIKTVFGLFVNEVLYRTFGLRR